MYLQQEATKIILKGEPVFNVTGKRFGKLVALEYQKLNGKAAWKCRCDCGQITILDSYSLRKGYTKSCGCIHNDLMANQKFATKHGMYSTRVYITWVGMKQRCLNPKATRYPSYGGAGIKLCDRWLKFENFYSDMGDRPEDKTLDRINPWGNYSPENCRWATPLEQQEHTRRKPRSKSSEGE